MSKYATISVPADVKKRLEKAKGNKEFDFVGVWDERLPRKNREWKGFTKFKEGYNPKVIEFLGTWDLVINPPLYWIYRLAELIRWATLRPLAKLGLSKNRF